MRRIPAAVLLMAVSAAAGCTTVSASPARGPAPRPSAPPAATPDSPDLTAPPAHQVLETVHPEPAPAPPEAPRRRREPGAQDRPPAATRHRVAPPEPAPTAGLPTGSLPGGPGVCALGETYGGWTRESAAARICRQSYGR